jgi:hypothetical protein
MAAARWLRKYAGNESDSRPRAPVRRPQEQSMQSTPGLGKLSVRPWKKGNIQTDRGIGGHAHRSPPAAVRLGQAKYRPPSVQGGQASFPRAWRAFRSPFRQPQDDVGIALARAASSQVSMTGLSLRDFHSGGFSPLARITFSNPSGSPLRQASWASSILA